MLEICNNCCLTLWALTSNAYELTTSYQRSGSLAESPRPPVNAPESVKIAVALAGVVVGAAWAGDLLRDPAGFL